MAKQGSSIRRVLRVLGVTAIVMCLYTPWAVALPSFLLNDGQTHIINYFEMGSEYSIYNNINPPHNPTTAIFDFAVMTGGASYASVYGNSILYLISGQLDDIRAYDHSTVIMSGGVTGLSHAFYAYGNSKVTITGGDVENGGFAGSKLLITGGELDNYNIGGDKADIYGGDFRYWIFDYLTFSSDDMDIHGGTFSGNILFEAYKADIYGGAWWDTILSIYGNVIIHGSNFNMPLGTYTATDNLNNLTGILADGTPLSFTEINIYGGTVTLVPEPSTMLLLGSGLIGLWGFRKKFKK